MENNLENILKDFIYIQREYKKLFNAKALTKKSMCNLLVPIRDKYCLSDREVLSVARGELDLAQTIEIAKKTIK